MKESPARRFSDVLLDRCKHTRRCAGIHDDALNHLGPFQLAEHPMKDFKSRLNGFLLHHRRRVDPSNRVQHRFCHGPE